MVSFDRPKILITGATGQVGSRVLHLSLSNPEIDWVAATRSSVKAAALNEKGIATVMLDLDDESTHREALEGIDRIFLVTGYTVDMLRQSKALLDNAKKGGVKHIVHLGACGRDDTTVAHWAWHQLVERYIEWCGFSFTHLRPEAFMQNLLGYGGKKSVEDGVVQAFVGPARISWVDIGDIAEVAIETLSRPDLHAGQTYRLGYDALTYEELAALMTSIIGQPFRYEARPPELFLQDMISSGAEMAYMGCVYDHYKRYAADTIPGADDTFDNFIAITGRQPTRWIDFIARHKADFAY